MGAKWNLLERPKTSLVQIIVWHSTNVLHSWSVFSIISLSQTENLKVWRKRIPEGHRSDKWSIAYCWLHQGLSSTGKLTVRRSGGDWQGLIWPANNPSARHTTWWHRVRAWDLCWVMARWHLCKHFSQWQHSLQMTNENDKSKWHVDQVVFIYGYPILKWVVMTWQRWENSRIVTPAMAACNMPHHWFRGLSPMRHQVITANGDLFGDNRIIGSTLQLNLIQDAKIFFKSK